MQEELSNKIDQLLDGLEAQVDATNALRVSLQDYIDWLQEQAKGGQDV